MHPVIYEFEGPQGQRGGSSCNSTQTTIALFIMCKVGCFVSHLIKIVKISQYLKKLPICNKAIHILYDIDQISDYRVKEFRFLVKKVKVEVGFSGFIHTLALSQNIWRSTRLPNIRTCFTKTVPTFLLHCPLPIKIIRFWKTFSWVFQCFKSPHSWLGLQACT